MGQISDGPRRVRGMYFSGTGTTEKIVTAVASTMAQRLDGRVSSRKLPDIDFTPPEMREQTFPFDDHDIVIFGVPVIAGRVPNVLLPFLNTLEGGGAMAVPIVVYGNRDFDDALIELRDILEERGFHTIAAAAFIGEHSFSRILAAGRPDERDMAIAEDLAGQAAERTAGLLEDSARRAMKRQGGGPLAADGELNAILEGLGPVPVDGQMPLRPYYKPRDRQGKHINILKVKPKLDASKCTRCGICVKACPMGSIKAEEPGVVKGICIKCCGCEKKCPEGALYFDDPGYLYHKEELELGYPERKEPKLFL